MGSNEGVPHECVGLPDATEQFQCVSKVAGERKSGKGEYAAGGVVVVDAAGDNHLGVDLLELVH